MRHFSFVEAVSEPFFDPKTTFAMPKSVLEEGQNRSENHCLEGISAGFFEELWFWQIASTNLRNS